MTIRISSQQFLVTQNISLQVILGTDYLSQTRATCTLIFKDSTFMLCQEVSTASSDPIRVGVADRTVIPAHYVCTLQVTCNVFIQS